MKNNNMKLKKQIYKHTSGSSSEYYLNPKGQVHGPYIRFWSNGQKNWESSFIFDRGLDIGIGIWKRYNSDGRRRWMDTHKNGRLNGVTINFEM